MFPIRFSMILFDFRVLSFSLVYVEIMVHRKNVVTFIIVFAYLFVSHRLNTNKQTYFTPTFSNEEWKMWAGLYLRVQLKFRPTSISIILWLAQAIFITAFLFIHYPTWKINVQTMVFVCKISSFRIWGTKNGLCCVFHCAQIRLKSQPYKNARVYLISCSPSNGKWKKMK